MRIKWAPFCNFRVAFFKKGGPPEGIWTYWYLLFHEKTNFYWCFSVILEHSGQLKSLDSNYCRILDVCLVKYWLKWKRERQYYWDSKRLIKVQRKFIEWPSNQFCCQWCFQMLYLKKMVLTLGFFFCAPFNTAIQILCGIFSNSVAEIPQGCV